MLHKTLPILGLACGLAIAPIAISPLVAHQTLNAKSLKVMAHLNPDDSPYAGKPALTWFMLMRDDETTVSPANCNCRVMAYDAQKKAIAHHFPLSTMSVAGHKANHKAIRTTITFPKPGSYTVVLAGSSKDGSFAPFELKFPIKVRP